MACQDDRVPLMNEANVVKSSYVEGFDFGCHPILTVIK